MKVEIGMRRKKYKKNLVFLCLAIVFSMTTILLGGHLLTKLKQFKETKATMVEVEANKLEKEEKLGALHQSIKEKEEEVATLQVQVEQLKTTYPNLFKETGMQDTKRAYLTFDDGPSANTEKILDFLKANNIKATFFVIGTQGYDDLYKRIVNEGHTLAIHSNTHQYDEIYKSVDAFMEDIGTLSTKLEKLTGVKPNILRFPGGSNNTVSNRYNSTGIMDKIIQEVTKDGYHYYDWNVDSLDASAKLQNKDIIVKSVLDGARDMKNAIILMHDASIKTTTVDALPEIVEGLRKEGYVFDRITEETPVVQFK